ncbi:putative phosphotransferase [Agrococcus terreus]|uniref:Phosphotransferase n=1 Tax=Agrococcus terreus TaxID=574649 RepID=A0ABQ2KM38_9MICO|nr:putative phosphotransferase [Agrococcus terreus]
MPTAIGRLAGTDPVELVWRNELGGITARIDRADAAVYAKWQPGGGTLPAEAERLAWLDGRLPAPRVLALREEDGGALLVTAGIAGASIVSAAGLRDPAAAAAALGEGLRRLHALPVAECPFPAPAWTRAMPPEHPVVVHGDACAPNTLIAGGAFAALVDVGELGVADRWADLAIASWSLEWNGLAEAEPAFWRAYGIRPDPERIARWRALWDEPGLED